MNKLNSFVKQFIAIVTGDDVEAYAQKAWRSAESALKVHIAAMEGDIIALEDAVEQAKEGLNNARVNGGYTITDREQYIDNLVSAKNNLTDAEEELAAHMESIAFLKEEYATLRAVE